MTETPSEIQTADRRDAIDATIHQLERQRVRRAALRDRHAQGLTRLMDKRDDLRGILPLADFVDDAVRWTT